MSIFDRFLGLISAVAYGLQRAKFGFVRLRVGVVLLCFVAAAYAAYRSWRTGFAPAYGAIVLLSCTLAALLIWVDRRRYIVFHDAPAPATESAPDVRAEEQLFLRSSGTFQVSNMSRYLVEVPVVFWTTQLADHILAAKVRAFNVLGIGVPAEERGWWYVFIEPRRVIGLQTGQLCFGLRLCAAVRVAYQGAKGHEIVYLSCDNVEQFARLVKELESKAAWQPSSHPQRGGKAYLSDEEEARKKLKK